MCAWTGSSGSCDGDECVQSALRKGGSVLSRGDGSYSLTFDDNTCGAGSLAVLTPAFHADGSGYFNSTDSWGGVTTFEPNLETTAYLVAVSWTPSCKFFSE